MLLCLRLAYAVDNYLDDYGIWDRIIDRLVKALGSSPATDANNTFNVTSRPSAAIAM